MSEENKLTIKAAIKCEGIIYDLDKPKRHKDIVKRYGEFLKDAKHGFLINGDFYSRKKAAKYAKENGLLPIDSDIKKLHTRDLW